MTLLPDWSEDQLSELIGNRFACQKCHACCRQPGYVYMSEGDLLKACRGLGISEREFVDQYCDLVDRRKLVLKKKDGEDCVFLDLAKGCLIHPFKPSQCVVFPQKWRTPASWNYCKGLQKLDLSI